MSRPAATCLLALLVPVGASALPPPAQQHHAVLQPEGEQPHQGHPFGPPTEFDRTIRELSHQLLEAYHTKDMHNHTSVYPLLSLMAATDVEDDEEY